MKKFTRIAAVLLAVIMAFSFAACNKATDDGTSTTEAASCTSTSGKTYIIASDNAFAPFEYLDTATNTYVGIDMDILAAVAADQGFKYEIQNIGFKAATSAVQTGSADGAIAGMTITDERKETFDFSDGYFDDGQILVVASDSSITKLEDLSGKSVAVKSSTMGATYAASIADTYGFTLKYYEDSPTMYQAVSQGTNDACFEDYSVIGWAIKSTSSLGLKTVGDVINSAPYGFAVQKGSNAELLSMFNAGLANIKANGKLAEILAKYGY